MHTHQAAAKAGLAKRSESYGQEVARCRRSKPEPGLNRLHIDKALALGTAELLTPPERCLMFALLSHLDVAGTASGKTAVWPGASRLSSLLGIAPSTLRRLKASLEEKGLLLRRYDHRNRPLSEGAIDLKPFLLKVPEILASLGHTEDGLREESQLCRDERQDGGSSMSTHPPKAEHAIEGNHPKEIFERGRGILEGEGRSSRDAPEDDRDFDLATELLGPAKAARLWPLAKRKLGPRASLALRIAQHHRTIRDRAAWFAWLATAAPSDIDLEAMATDLPKETAAREPISFYGDPLLKRLVDVMGAMIGGEAALSYLAGSIVSIEEECLRIVPARRLAAKRLQDRYCAELVQAARQLGCSAVSLGEGTHFAAAPEEGERRPDQPARETPARLRGCVTPLPPELRDPADTVDEAPPIGPSRGCCQKPEREGDVHQSADRQQQPIEKGRQCFGSEPDPVAAPVIDGERAMPSCDPRTFVKDNGRGAKDRFASRMTKAQAEVDVLTIAEEPFVKAPGGGELISPIKGSGAASTGNEPLARHPGPRRTEKSAIGEPRGVEAVTRTVDAAGVLRDQLSRGDARSFGVARSGVEQCLKPHGLGVGVGVQEGDESGARLFHGSIVGRGKAEIVPHRTKGDAGKSVLSGLEGSIGGSVVRHDHALRRPRLLMQASQTTLQTCAAIIIDDNDRDVAHTYTAPSAGNALP
ncbi:MAG: hypothetical protein AAGG79_04000 [Pseudomonadota bacterium]